MEAGRNLDSDVATKVMGWTVELIANPVGHSFEEWRDSQGWRYGPTPPPFSTEIAAAWQVAEKLNLSLLRSVNGWVAGILVADYPENGWLDCEILHDQLAPTAPLAICRAALAAVAT